jgi:hypothetical protein
MAITCLPWAWRNYSTFQSVFFVRSNFGLELRIANHEGATVERETLRHPRASREEALQVVKLGEIEYMRRQREEATEWILANPTQFAWLTIKRVAYFWLGPPNRPDIAVFVASLTLLAIVGVARAFPYLSLPERTVLLIPLVTYPPLYYLLCYLRRYREPLDWILFMFAGVALWHWIAHPNELSTVQWRNGLDPEGPTSGGATISADR